MRILVITHNTPYPLSDGGKIAQFSIIDYLRHRCSLTLILFADSNNDIEQIELLKNIWNNVNIKVIQNRDTSSVVDHSFIKNLKSFILRKIDNFIFGHNKFIRPKKESIPSDFDNHERIINYLISFSRPRKMEIINQIRDLIYDVNPDLIQLDFVETLDLVLCIPNHIKKVFVHHEVRYRRIETEIATMNNQIDFYGKYAQNYCEILEVSLLNKFNGIVTFSEEDRIRLLEKVSVKNILTSPFSVLDDDLLEIHSEYHCINKLVFVGFENHSPNRDAIEWYANNISTLILEKFGLVLHVIGNWSSDFKMKYAYNTAIHFSGYVEDLSHYCKDSIMIVPVRIGSGIRTKILHSMAWGIPVITTKIGCEGIVDNENIFVHADTPNEFIEGIDRILNDKEFHKSLVVNAQLILKHNYSQNIAGKKRLLFYQSIIEN